MTPSDGKRFRPGSRRLRLVLSFAVVAGACALAAPRPARGDDFPPITELDRSVNSVRGEPNARAVVLFRRGDLKMPDPTRELTTSILTVVVREKILTEKGLDEGTVRIAHSSFTRLHEFEGRTILRDGTIVPLSKDAKFTTTASKARRQFVTSVAFPNVEVGAILDYHYKLYWDTFTDLLPWYFAGRVPIVYSEILYHLPPKVEMGIWGFGPGIDRVKSEPGGDVLSRTFRVSAENLASLPDERYAPPASDFSPRVMLVPKKVSVGGMLVYLLNDWASTCELYKDTYRTALKDDSDATALARTLAGKEADAAAKAVKLYRYVRDNVRTDEGSDPEPHDRVTADKVLARKHGTSAEKSLLLLACLNAVKVPAHLVWAADRSGGLIDLSVPTPAWFSRVLVAVETGKERLFLDPADPTAAAGHIEPGFEGMPALLYDYKKPEVITLPETPFDRNRRAARLDVAVAEDGTVEGQGTLTLTGHDGWEKVGWKDSPERAAAAWKEWLEARLKGFVVSDVKVSEAVEESRVDVAWRLESAEAGGETEVILAPAAPLGPSTLASAFPSTGRQTPVLFDYGDRDEVEWHVTWPAGWELEAPPTARDHESGAGAIVTTAHADAAARTLVTTRRLDIARRLSGTMGEYDALRQLLLETQRHDAENVVLRRR